MSTTPSASAQKLNCYIAEQVETAPYDTARLNLPETFSGGRPYNVQYGRQMQFADAGTQTTSIRLPKQLYSDVTLDALVNNTGVASDPFALSVDFGDDGILDWTHSATMTFPATLNVTGTADSLNAYLVSRTDVAWGADVDVPVRVVSDRASDVLLTNLVLRLQINQPTTLAATSVETGADRPLDWPISVNGTFSQGAQYDFTHTLGPDAASLHPCLVYDQNGNVLKGVGKYCTDLGEGTASYEMFGDGRDGVMPGSGNLDNANGFAAGSVNGAAGATSIAVTDRYAIARVNPGDVILIHQTRGSGAGQWELNKAAADFTGSGTFALGNPLKYAYVSNSGNEKAQILRVPQYSSCNVTGTVTPLAAWNGDWGGIFTVLCNDTMSLSGTISASGFGDRGGQGGHWCNSSPCPESGPYNRPGGGYGESYNAPPQGSRDQEGVNTSANAGAGGGGLGRFGGGAAKGGGGGSYGTAGTAGIWGGASAGSVYGSADLGSRIYLGSGGGGGGKAPNNDYNSPGGNGGSGGGIIIVYAQMLDIGSGGTVQSSGAGGGNASNNRDESGGGGGGSGGSVRLIGGIVSLGSNRVVAIGGSGGGGSKSDETGGNGGSGRIRVEYCETVVGTTNPQTSPEKLDCFVAEQLETEPFTTTRLYLPDEITSGQSYLVQYARRFVFAAADELTSTLRLNRRVYGSASLDLLVGNAGVASGDLALCLDLGNDGVCDYSQTGSTDFPAKLEATDLAEALNTYLLGRNDIAWGGPVDVPVRLSLDRQADVMLTNLALTPLGAKTRFVRTEARNYANATLGLEFRQPGTSSGPLAFTVDVGADGTVDWSYAGTPSFPARLTSPNLADAINAYLAGRSGEVDVPIRIVPSPFLDLSLVDFDAAPTDRPDLSPIPPTASVARSGSGLVEGNTVPLTSIIQNSGPADSGPVAITFYATPPSTSLSLYIGTAFVPNIPAAGTAPATVQWNTLGFSGDIDVNVVVDPYSRVSENSENDNSVSATITVLTRPDLSSTAIALSDSEPLVGETVTVTIHLRNAGQTDAAAQTLSLFDGNPESGGAAIGITAVAPIPGDGASQIAFTWTPTTPGPYRLFSLSDRDNVVDEYDEGNNRSWQDVYVGLAAPLLLDSGPDETEYTPATGFGVVDEDQPDVLAVCGGGATPEETLRRDPGGRLVYRFDHLQPGHHYHLDITLLECDRVGRQQTVYVDGNPVSQSQDLGDAQIHRLSLLLDPALYADRAISVTVESPGVDGAIVNTVSLHDIDYRYADSGGNADPPYPGDAAYGWLDGTGIVNWGRLPYQSVRVNQDKDQVRYRFDNLDPEKEYDLGFTFWQGSGDTRAQEIHVDNEKIGDTVTVESGVRKDLIVSVPPDAYQEDGSIFASVVRTDADTGAIVSTIALEERTVEAAASCDGLSRTPFYSIAFGYVQYNGQPAPTGTVVQAFNPRGDVVGCFEVETAGEYGAMFVYGEDDSVTPPAPGMRAEEPVLFKVNGVSAVATPLFYWQDDRKFNQVDLRAAPAQGQSILLDPDNWNLISFAVEPINPLPSQVLRLIDGRYDRILGDGTLYDPTLPDAANNLRSMRPGDGYMLHFTGSLADNVLIEGIPVPITTPITIEPGWNWIGYLPDTSLPLEQALQSIEGKYVRVISEDDAWDVDYPNFSTLKTMFPGAGYQLYATEAATLTYPTPSAAAIPVSTEVTPQRSCRAQRSPGVTLAYGSIWIGESPAPVNTLVEAVDADGAVIGCTYVRSPGQFGLTPIYSPQTDGLTAMDAEAGSGQPVYWRINGFNATADMLMLWQPDRAPHEFRIDIDLDQIFFPWVALP